VLYTEVSHTKKTLKVCSGADHNYFHTEAHIHIPIKDFLDDIRQDLVVNVESYNVIDPQFLQAHPRVDSNSGFFKSLGTLFAYSTAFSTSSLEMTAGAAHGLVGDNNPRVDKAHNVPQ
jgi:hypothetical protein